jgi:hypothetical protein
MAIKQKIASSCQGRGITRNPPEQPDLENAFECDDMLATYEELKAKGVKFTKEPTKEFYGFNACSPMNSVTGFH